MNARQAARRDDRRRAGANAVLLAIALTRPWLRAVD
jgi:hypothetical protein